MMLLMIAFIVLLIGVIIPLIKSFAPESKPKKKETITHLPEIVYPEAVMNSFDLTGSLAGIDLTGLSGLSGVMRTQDSASLTGITFPTSSTKITSFDIKNKRLKG